MGDKLADFDADAEEHSNTLLSEFDALVNPRPSTGESFVEFFGNDQRQFTGTLKGLGTLRNALDSSDPSRRLAAANVLKNIEQLIPGDVIEETGIRSTIRRIRASSQYTNAISSGREFKKGIRAESRGIRQREIKAVTGIKGMIQEDFSDLSLKRQKQIENFIEKVQQGEIP